MTLDDIDDAFRLQALGGAFVPLRFLEPVSLSARHGGGSRAGDVTICAIAAGHSLGGAVWQISTAR